MPPELHTHARQRPRALLLRAGALLLLTGALALGLGSGCARDAEPDATPTLQVFAASSLTEAFDALARGFERAHPGTRVALSFAGSQVLRLQIEQGARADVYASANGAHMDALRAAALLGASEVFAHNQLVVITPRDNPAGIERFADLARAERLVIGADTVPVGVYTRALFERAASDARPGLGPDFAAAVRAHVVSAESNVRLVRAKVELGEADAAIVYRTDALASERVRVVPVPAELAAPAGYHIGVLANAAHADAARAWLAYLGSHEGRATLRAHGFSAPATPAAPAAPAAHGDDAASGAR
ncbi:molybdate ABC transporter substrate-binding protein [Haliangium ochraceum]|uniref:Molybdenum ABC transporter, periplasmic molybdate-binding protein n=1 Tax=Haliangium ochraceum (strain DSM 14365 / JCM 11303 / SMP-2) TaxID=502025 RepID=D0LM97_HALO1|nr:molybdate ABC transporter substrate-binding protein [Haliangium ochraceum]ACY16803.1 molybdenum ABC transporter, periplasmic molybdate-binding protein [Haliangium ochraceum DSM 14365]